MIEFQKFWILWQTVTTQPNGKSKAVEYFKANCSVPGYNPEELKKATENYKQHYLSQKDNGLKPMNAYNFLCQYPDWVEYVDEEKAKRAQRDKEIAELEEKQQRGEI
jgi:hypothetical protein